MRDNEPVENKPDMAKLIDFWPQEILLSRADGVHALMMLPNSVRNANKIFYNKAKINKNTLQLYFSQREENNSRKNKEGTEISAGTTEDSASLVLSQEKEEVFSDGVLNNSTYCT